jgi:hypothetical protein
MMKMQIVSKIGKYQQKTKECNEIKESARRKNKKRETEIIYVFKTSVNLAVQTRKGTNRQMDWIGSRNQVCSLLHPIINFPVERACCIGQSSCRVITGRSEHGGAVGPQG